MSPRAVLAGVASLCALALLGCAGGGGGAGAGEAWPRPPAWRHAMVVHDAPVRHGRTRGAIAVDGKPWIEFDLERGTGIYQSPVLPSGMDFREMVLSWNIDASEGVSCIIEARVRAKTTPEMAALHRQGSWSPWVRMGRVGGVRGGEPDALREWAWGRVDVDVIRLDVAADALQYRVQAFGDGPAGLSRMAMAMSRERASLSWAEDASTFVPRPVEVEVPFLSQRAARDDIAGRVCSPTSVAMVVGSHGVRRSTEEVASMVLDPDFDLYGNWPRNVQAAHALGVSGYVARFSSWGPVQRHLDAGRALIVSLKAGPGELPGAPYETTKGHLLVLRGFDENGDCIVSDPAAVSVDAGEAVYPRAAMERVWMGRGAGTAYVLGVD